MALSQKRNLGQAAQGWYGGPVKLSGNSILFSSQSAFSGTHPQGLSSLLNSGHSNHIPPRRNEKRILPRNCGFCSLAKNKSHIYKEIRNVLYWIHNIMSNHFRRRECVLGGTKQSSPQIVTQLLSPYRKQQSQIEMEHLAATL